MGLQTSNNLTISMKIAFIDTSYPLNNRNDKLIESFYLNYPGCEIHAITWNRENLSIEELGYIVHSYEVKSQLGNYVDKLRKLFGFYKYVKSELRKISPDIIIASHWETLIAGSLYKGSAKKLVYENLDIPTGGKFIRTIIVMLERMSLKKADMIIHASRFYKDLYSQNIPQYVLENKPTLFDVNDYTPLQIHAPLRISFIGSLRYPDIFYTLIDAVKDDDRVHLSLHGAGSHFESISQYAKEISNITLTGRYAYNDIKHLYDESDLIWAVYPSKDYNVKYAISNKFHESMMLRRPGIYCSGTKLGDFVSENRLGFVVNPYDVNEIKKLINRILKNPSLIHDVERSISQFVVTEKTWEEDFKEIQFI